jgi:exopolysaccharide biosynthesis polyprenyl glycosylphosphotransferase
MNNSRQTLKYIITDYFMAAASWMILFGYRKKYFEGVQSSSENFDDNFFLGLVLVPAFWITLYFVSGQYYEILRRYRVKELAEISMTTIVGVLAIFFVLLLDDRIVDYKSYYKSILVLTSSHMLLTLTGRLIHTTATVRKVHSGVLGFNTIMVGGNARALSLFEEIQQMKSSPGLRFIGFVRVNGNDNLLEKHIPFLGKYPALPEIIDNNQIEEVIVAVESGDHKDLQQIISLLQDKNVRISIIPDMYDILSGSVKLNSVYGVPLIRINQGNMPLWQFAFKRLLDMICSILALILLSPLMIIIACAIQYSSRGPVFFSQQRIGRYGKPFRIYKFRSMVVDAEAEGPQLSSENDARVTRVGRILRKTRMDEIPQFFNVLIGEMSLVGPRPERDYFIQQIMEKAPHYRHLQRVRPGITSWGQVKFGYAENVDQMIQRLKYDILYIENMSLAMDIKILFYTVLIVLKGTGK